MPTTQIVLHSTVHIVLVWHVIGHRAILTGTTVESGVRANSMMVVKHLDDTVGDTHIDFALDIIHKGRCNASCPQQCDK